MYVFLCRMCMSLTFPPLLFTFSLISYPYHISCFFTHQALCNMHDSLHSIFQLYFTKPILYFLFTNSSVFCYPLFVPLFPSCWLSLLTITFSLALQELPGLRQSSFYFLFIHSLHPVLLSHYNPIEPLNPSLHSHHSSLSTPPHFSLARSSSSVYTVEAGHSGGRSGFKSKCLHVLQRVTCFRHAGTYRFLQTTLGNIPCEDAVIKAVFPESVWGNQ